MTLDEYVKLAIKTESADFLTILPRISNTQFIRLDHASKGMITEVGEFVDELKKWQFYGKAYTTIALVEELGDLMWYIAIACDALDIPPEQILERNIAKLKARYGDEFNEEGALNRDLENEKEALKIQTIHYIINPLTHNSKTICGIAHRFAIKITEDKTLVTCENCKYGITRLHFDKYLNNERSILETGHSAMLCEHANEVPANCPCDSDCYCKTHTCKSRVHNTKSEFSIVHFSLGGITTTCGKLTKEVGYFTSNLQDTDCEVCIKKAKVYYDRK